jgi:hypothetical protein
VTDGEAAAKVVSGLDRDVLGQVVLVLQGGGALGAEAGAVDAPVRSIGRLHPARSRSRPDGLRGLEHVPLKSTHIPLHVMAGLVPAIHGFAPLQGGEDVDARDNPRIKSGDGHDG